MRVVLVSSLLVFLALAGCTADATVDCNERYAVVFPGYTYEGYKQDFERNGRAWFDEDGDCFHDVDERDLGTDPQDASDYPRSVNGVESTDPYEFLVSMTPSRTSGEAPLTVAFEFGVPVGNSPDVTWTLGVDGNTTIAEGTGDDLPGNTSYIFEQAGTFQVTFHATDGKEESEQTVGITVTVPFVCRSVTPTGSFTVNDEGYYQYNNEVWQESNGHTGLQVADPQDCQPDTKVSP